MSNKIKYQPKNTQDSIDKIEKAGIMTDILSEAIPLILEGVFLKFFQNNKIHLITESMPALYTAIAAGMPVTMLNFLEDQPQYDDVMKDDYKIQLLDKSIERLQQISQKWKDQKKLI